MKRKTNEKDYQTLMKIIAYLNWLEFNITAKQLQIILKKYNLI